MLDWSHAVVAIIAGCFTKGLDFLYKRQITAVESLLKIVGIYSERVSILEQKLDKLHEEHAECREMTAALSVEVEILKSNTGRGPNRTLPVTM